VTTTDASGGLGIDLAETGNRYVILSGMTITAAGGSADTDAPTPDPDTDAPTPDPATFASAPSADSESAISMTATTGTDATGPVEYYFDETTAGPGATDSGWQTSPSYTDSGLTASTQYTYTVQMRDSAGTPNVGTASSGANATTDSPPELITLIDDDFEGTLANWSTDWDLVTSYYVSSNHSVECSSSDNDLISIDLDASAATTNVRVQFKYRINNIDSVDDVRIYYWDGSAYDYIEEIGDDAEDTWLTYDHTTTDAQYRNSTFKIYIEGSSIDLAGSEALWIDDVLITCE
jgi:hypothetical protein